MNLLLESHVLLQERRKSCIFREYNRINGKTCCVDIACTPLERKDDIRVRYIKLDYRIYLFK